VHGNEVNRAEMVAGLWICDIRHRQDKCSMNKLRSEFRDVWPTGLSMDT
jgi:hypothetical protein